ncbi:diguanylate cyclase [Salinimonas marina]|uniref:diguanylate cyclase n=1 Tax=Salinimonas marina TaxID=2785918 RepID=A0A7S9DXM7_9ALTE|nr:diguanylate cyclase [Salinimonas marina]QPG05155.1 diguanylate cyclase [Salinimonas marina]
MTSNQFFYKFAWMLAVLWLCNPPLAKASEPVFDTPTQLDMDYYSHQIATQPDVVLDQLLPILQNTNPAPSPQIEMQARYLVAHAYHYLSQHNEIEAIASKGLTLAKNHGNKKFEARFLGMLAFGALNAQNIAVAMDSAQRSIELAASYAPDTLFHGEVLLLAARVFYESEAISKALKAMVKANDIFTRLNDTKSRSEALASIALIYDELGQPQQALEYYMESLALIDPEENLIEASITYYNIALTYRNTAYKDKARVFAEKSLEYANKASDDVGAAYALYELAYLDEQAQAFERSMERVDQVIPVFEEHQITGMTILSHLLRARLRARQNHPGWEVDLAIAEPLVAKATTLKRQIALVRSKAVIHESLGNVTKALSHYKQWVTLNEQQLEDTQKQSTRRYQAMFELNEAAAENKLLSTQKKLAESELEAKEFRQWVLIILSLALLVVLAAAITVLMIQIRTKKKFRRLALVDELTHARNRRSISVYAQKAIRAAQANQSPLCFAMIDIDFFKAFNDRFGHDVGDEVLKKVAQTITSELRGRDALGRWGGEEWLLVLPDSSSEHIGNIFERIQTKLTTMDLKVPDAPAITVSMGCTDLHASDSTLEQVVKRADEALYQAKENGRNRFETRAA